MFPGITARIRHPDTDEELPIFESGMLWLRGANVFEGYLNDSRRTGDVLQDGWYKTGDIGRLDEDGFLYIEGRMSRFSKIAGEMIPHLTVEQKIAEAMQQPAHAQEGPSVVVIGVPDDKRGESLVILTTLSIDQTDLRQKLAALGLPNLWIPKVIKRVAAIPLLATGKLDIRTCQQLAAKEEIPVATP